ncbi:MAG: hypothetical protein HYY84_06480 [Deltaproteobacteria bacterium]|nr:hypothetical protein [Deltaproteobacteria bacterium]
MKATNDFERLLSELKAIPAERVREPNLAVATLFHEAFDLAETAERYRPQLIAAGLEERFVDSLSARANALRAAQTAWTHARDAATPVEYLALVDQATVLRRDFVATAGYALRKHERALETLARIQEGEGVADLCQDLTDLAQLAESHRDDFARTDFDAAQIVKARKVADAVTKLHATVAADRAENRSASSEAKDLRDRAATYLDEAVDEVRSAGLYAFRNDSDTARLAQFRSVASIQRARRRHAAKKASDSTPIAPAAPATAPRQN